MKEINEDYTFNGQLNVETPKGSVVNLNTVKPYKVYKALLTQTTDGGVGNDEFVMTANILENSIGDLVWSRASAGVFEGIIAEQSVFPELKTICIPLNPRMLGLSAGAGEVLFFRSSESAVQIQTFSDRFETPADDLLENFPIEIQVWE